MGSIRSTEDWDMAVGFFHFYLIAFTVVAAYFTGNYPLKGIHKRAKWVFLILCVAACELVWWCSFLPNYTR